MAPPGLSLAPMSMKQQLDGDSTFLGRTHSLKAKAPRPRALLCLKKLALRPAITARSEPESSASSFPTSPKAPLFELFPEDSISQGNPSVTQSQSLSQAPSSSRQGASSSTASGPRRVSVRPSADQKVKPAVMLLKMYTTKLSPASPTAVRAPMSVATSQASSAPASPRTLPASRGGARASVVSRTPYRISSPTARKAEGRKKASKVVLRLHSVQAGETLHSIAHRYSIPVDALRAANEKAASGVRVREVLFLPSPAHMEEADSAVQSLGGEQAVILLSPKARMLLRKATMSEEGSQAEADTSVFRALSKAIQSALDLGVVSQGQQASLELMGVTASDLTSAVARPGAALQPGSREGSTSSAVFASVQAASPFGARGLYGGEFTAGAIFGRSSLTIGICLLLLGSASSLQSVLLKQLGPDGALLGVGKALKEHMAAETDAGLSPSSLEPLDPAQRTARRFLTELKSGGRERTEMLLEYKLGGIPTGEEVLLRRARSPRDLVTALGCIDTGLCLEVLDSSEEDSAWTTEASELEYFEAHAASVRSVVAGLVAAVDLNPEWDVRTAREANMKATTDPSSEQA